MSRKAITALIAVVLGFSVGIIFASILGIKFVNGGIETYMPHEILALMFKSVTGINFLGHGGFNLRNVGEFLVASMPLILTGLSVAFAFKTGLFNIGAEGQVLVGSVAATMGGLFLDLPPIIHPIVCLILAALAGFVFGAVPGYLKARFNVHEVVTCIMMNYIAFYGANMIYKSFDGFSNEHTPLIKDTAFLHSKEGDILRTLTNGSRFDWAFIVVIIAVLAFWFIIKKTTFGYRLRTIGSNKEAARYAGMRVNQGIVLSMGISGIFAGLAGAILVLSIFGYGRVLTGFENYGYNGIAVALVGANTALGTVLSGGLFGMLAVAQPILQQGGVPKDIAVVISALIIFFCAIPLAYAKIVDKIVHDKNEPEPEVEIEDGGEL
jgi:general nucleoside transport system permease protein